MKTFNQPLRFISLMVLAIAVSLGFSSCNSDDDGPVVYNVQEYATFLGNNVGRAEFQVQRTGNGPVYTLYATGTINEQNIRPGSRVLLAYQITPENNETNVELPTSGEINVIGVSGILTLYPKTVNMEADSLRSWDLSPVYLDQLTRTGYYINMMARVDCDPNNLSSTFDLFADSASLNTNEPRLYLRYNSPNISNQAYVPASLDISTLWGNPAYEGVVLNINNSKTNKSIFQFLKSQDGYTD